jgi:hypothetical protein
MIIREFKTEPVLINLAKRYKDWHTPGRPDSRKTRIGEPGSGREFLEFHRSLLDEFFAWNATHRVVDSIHVAPWTAVPSELKVPETGWPHPGAAFGDLDLGVGEIRLSTNTPPFGNDDDLGIFIENTIISWIHGAIVAAPAFDLYEDKQEDDKHPERKEERSIIISLRAPESTWFYKIYGLTQLWWCRYLYPVSTFKDNNDIRVSGKDANDFKGKDSNDFKGKDSNDFKGKDANDFKGKESNDFGMSGSGFKEIVDNPGGEHFKEILDAYKGQTALPSLLNNLLARVQELEERAKIKKSPFITPFLRPPVGRATIRSKRKKNR